MKLKTFFIVAGIAGAAATTAILVIPSAITGGTAIGSHTKPGGISHILTPDAQGHLSKTSWTGYKPGDTIYLSGVFKAIAFDNLVGVGDNYYVITNKPNETVIIGDSVWSGGSWAQGMVLHGCHYIEIAGTDKTRFKFIGSNSNIKDANGVPTKTAYTDIALSQLTDNISLHDVTIRYGGAGVFAKTEVSSTNSATWFPNTYLNNWEFYKLDISGTYNEAMYIGHTANYWNIQSNTPYYPTPTDPAPDQAIYKRPIKLTNVKIYNNYIHDIGNDAIQTAAIDSLEVYNNEVYNWATKHDASNNGGILIGGRVIGFNVHDNIVHEGWGEFMQVYAQGGGSSIIRNNLFVKNQGDGISTRGSEKLQMQITNNTIAYAGGAGLRINGYYGQGNTVAQKNLITNPKYNGGVINPNTYIYLENGGTVSEGLSPNENKKYATILQANVDTLNFYQPVLGGVSFGYGYSKNTPTPIPVPTPDTVPIPVPVKKITGTITIYSDGTYQIK